MAADGERLAWGATGARSIRRAHGRGEPAQTATAIPALLSSLSSTQGSTSAHYLLKGVQPERRIVRCIEGWLTTNLILNPKPLNLAVV